MDTMDGFADNSKAAARREYHAYTSCAISETILYSPGSHLVGFKRTSNRKVGSNAWPDALR
jgi:hypothetical protein